VHLAPLVLALCRPAPAAPTPDLRVHAVSDAHLQMPPEARSLPRRWDPRPFLTISGSLLFGIVYLGALGGIEDGGEDGPHLAIPVLGPFAFAMAMQAGAEQAGLLTFASFLEAGGLAMLACGLACGPPEPVVRRPQ
jgi:hypothetical protein